MKTYDKTKAMHALVPVKGYSAIPRYSVACAIARPGNGWVDANANYPLLRPDRRPLVIEFYYPTFVAP